ncbi:MAG TPA: hypothetical protein VGD14_25410, partial [bacterium]
CSKKRPVNYKIPNTIEAGKVIYAGVRSSSYGIKPFPDPLGWQNAMEKMSNYYEGSTPCGIWIVGKLRRTKSCFLEFPGDSTKYTNISFLDKDKHEQYLSHFDTVGIKVFLQVEPAHANVDTLIDVVLNRYKHHPCIIGFGVDVEWYREADNPEWGVKVEDDTAKAWEARVKSHNSNYQLFLKHWERDWMPKTYRGDIIFVDDSQELENFEKMVEEFVVYWADYFKPNTIFCQIGYRSDRPWWEKLKTPPKDIGMTIASNIEQKCGIFWVDFTLRDVLPTSTDSVSTN